MTDEEITFEELQEIVNSPLKNKRTIKDFVKTIYDLSNKNNQLKNENAELKEQVESLANTNIKAQNIIADLKAVIESLKDTLKAIATDTNEHITHNVAQNELDKWELAE